MARTIRQWYPDATYHITFRGVRKSALFRDESDYVLLQNKIRLAQMKYSFTLHCFCEMTNHVHLLITTHTDAIWKIMQWILTCYAMEYNRKYGLSGHVFDDRYHSKLITDPVYFLEVSRYIHLNPVKAGMVANPSEYPYTSYRCFVTNEKSAIVDPEMVLSMFPPNPREHYRTFTEGSSLHEEHEKQIMSDMKEDERGNP